MFNLYYIKDKLVPKLIFVQEKRKTFYFFWRSYRNIIDCLCFLLIREIRMDLFKYIVKRLLIAIPVLFIALTLTFFLGRAFPGNPFLAVFSKGTVEEYELYNFLVESHGLNDPILVQYQNFLFNLFSGNWGTSWGGYRREVALYQGVKSRRNSVHICNIIISSILAYIFGKKIGIYTAVHKDKKFSDFIRITTTIGSGIPNFILGLILVLILSRSQFYELILGIKTKFFPDPPRFSGMRLLDCLVAGDFTLFFDSVIHYFWPISILTFQFTLLFARQTRANMIDVLNNDYIRTARAKGCKEKQIIKKHAYRIAAIPNIAYIGILTPIMLSEIILMESIFQIPGFGAMMLRSFLRIDYNVQIVCISLSIIIVIFTNLITDVLYSIVDPRIRYS